MSRYGMRVAFVLGLGALLLLETKPAPSQSNPSDERPSLAEFLATRQLVVDGTFLGETEVRRTMPGCGSGPLGPYHSFDLRIRVNDVLIGVAEDSILNARSLGSHHFDIPFVPGARILFWGHRTCEDDWRLWGNFCVIGGDDRIHPYEAIRESFEMSPPASRTLAGLERELDSLLSSTSASGFNGAAAAGLVRVTAVDGLPSGVTGITTIECDSLGWALGKLSAMPRRVVFQRRYCPFRVSAGDSMLISVPSSFSGRTLVTSACPEYWVVQHGFLPGLGVAVPFVGSALDEEPFGLMLRKFLAKE